jgi:GNAT superfamily N-acetyltransferase
MIEGIKFLLYSEGMSIEIRPVTTKREKHIFLTFPWQIFKGDPLWVPPLLPERKKVTDPQRGLFFKNGYAEFFIAWKDGKPAGTICCAEDQTASKYKGYSECMFGFFECIEDYAVAEALLKHAERWARDRGMVGLYGPYHLDYEDSRGILIEGRDRPPALLCGHTPIYYAEFFERYKMPSWYADGVAYAIDLDLNKPQVQRLIKLADKIRARKNIVIRGADFGNIEGEIDNVLTLTNSALAHLPGFVPWTREAVEQVIRPMVSIADPDLALFAEIDGKAVGFFPGVPNINEILIHVNGLRYPWDYLRLLWHMRTKPKGISVKTVLVPPEHWDTGVGVLLFDELARRAAAKGYTWADLSITGEDNTDTAPLAKHMGAKIYKRYRMYKKEL